MHWKFPLASHPFGPSLVRSIAPALARGHVKAQDLRHAVRHPKPVLSITVGDQGRTHKLYCLEHEGVDVLRHRATLVRQRLLRCAASVSLRLTDAQVSWLDAQTRQRSATAPDVMRDLIDSQMGNLDSPGTLIKPSPEGEGFISRCSYY